MSSSLSLPGYVIRPAGDGDLDDILAVYRQCEDFLALGPQTHATPEMVRQDLALSRAQGGMYCLIRTTGGQSIGVIDYVTHGFEGNPAHAFLSLLMIAAPHRGQGLGREVAALIEREVERNQAVTAILSGVQVNNPAATRFWQRNGYQITGGPELMPDGTTVYHLRKELPPRYFAHLAATGDPAADLCRFYQAAGRPGTLAHVTAVAVEARRLALAHGLDEERAVLAALAHDLAAVVPAGQHIAAAEALGIAVSDADRAMPSLLHGPIAAEIVARRLGLDQDIVSAVRYHSTLRAGAGPLDMVVFLADKIAYDPRSPHHGEYLPALLAAESLAAAALVYLDFVAENGWRYGWHLHPNALAAYRQLLRSTAP